MAKKKIYVPIELPLSLNEGELKKLSNLELLQLLVWTRKQMQGEGEKKYVRKRRQEKNKVEKKLHKVENTLRDISVENKRIQEELEQLETLKAKIEKIKKKKISLSQKEAEKLREKEQLTQQIATFENSPYFVTSKKEMAYAAGK